MLRALFLSSLTILAISNAHALEPVEPQPAVPLTFTNQAYQKVVPAEALKMIKEGVVVIDVRNPIERLTEGYIKGSVNVPLSSSSLKSGAKLTAVPDFDQKVLVHCRSGVRAENAARILISTGYKHVYNMYGILQWPYKLENTILSK